jgi:E3 ubiquitin-protein ligase DOA10
MLLMQMCPLPRRRDVPLRILKQSLIPYISFEVLTAVVVKSSVSWDVTLENLIRIERSKSRAQPLFYALNRIVFPSLYLLSNLPFPEG